MYTIILNDSKDNDNTYLTILANKKQMKRNSFVRNALWLCVQ